MKKDVNVGELLPNHHRIKTGELHFSAVKAGHKRFEIRKNDRDYQPGDLVTLYKWPEDKAEPELTFRIGRWFSVFEQLPGNIVFDLVPLESEAVLKGALEDIKDISSKLGGPLFAEKSDLRFDANSIWIIANEALTHPAPRSEPSDGEALRLLRDVRHVLDHSLPIQSESAIHHCIANYLDASKSPSPPLLESLADSIYYHLMIDEALDTSPENARRIKAKRIAKVALAALTKEQADD